MKRSLSDKVKISLIAWLGEKIVIEYINDVVDKKYKDDGYELLFYSQLEYGAILHSWLDELKIFHKLSSEESDSMELENEFLRRNWIYSITKNNVTKEYVLNGKWRLDVKYSVKNIIIKNWIKEKLKDLTDRNRKNLISHFLRKNIYPDDNLINKFIEFNLILNNNPDGIILKLNNTKKYKYKEELREELKGFMTIDHLNLDERIPIYEGNIIFVEVKTQGASIYGKQKISYIKYMERGFKLIYYYVDVISFDDDEYELYEFIITNERELDEANRYYNQVWRNICEKRLTK